MRRYRDWMGFHYGWTGARWWLSIAGDAKGTYWLDVGTWRVRWTGRSYRPFFSERYGYTKWHHLGRLAATNSPRGKKR